MEGGEKDNSDIPLNLLMEVRLNYFIDLEFLTLGNQDYIPNPYNC